MTDEMRFDRRMSDADALMWGIEKDPLLRSTITAVAVLDRSPDRERFTAKIERASRLIPRLRQRVVASPLVPAPPRWVVEPNFDLQYHLRWVRAPGSGSLRDLLDMAEPIAMQSFDRARPLWEFTVVDGLADGKAALIQKLHHSITDGVGAIKLAMHMLDLEREPSAAAEPMPPAPEPEEPGPVEIMRDALAHARRRQFGIARRMGADALGAITNPVGSARAAVDLVGSARRVLAPAAHALSPVMTERSMSVRFDVLTAPLTETKAAAKGAGGRLNDAFLAAVLGGLRHYHEAHGVDVEELRTAMPINIRGEDTEDLAGNQFVPARFLVPLGPPDPVSRMLAVRELVAAQRAEPALASTDAIAGVLNRLPTMVVTQLFGSMLKGVDFITSNVPGTPVALYVAGARIEANFPFGPRSGAAANVVLLSYIDELHIGVNTDPAAVPDPDVFLACLEEGFEEVRKAG
jgi:diacylglycerol O-acyltransferase / wax synthase